MKVVEKKSIQERGEMRAQRSSLHDDRRRRRHWVIPWWVKNVVKPWPSTNFLPMSNNTLNLCIAHPFVTIFPINKIPNQPGILPSWVSRNISVSLCVF
jgi:hypothetical protein